MPSSAAPPRHRAAAPQLMPQLLYFQLSSCGVASASDFIHTLMSADISLNPVHESYNYMLVYILEKQIKFYEKVVCMG